MSEQNEIDALDRMEGMCMDSKMDMLFAGLNAEADDEEAASAEPTAPLTENPNYEC